MKFQKKRQVPLPYFLHFLHAIIMIIKKYQYMYMYLGSCLYEFTTFSKIHCIPEHFVIHYKNFVKTINIKDLRCLSVFDTVYKMELEEYILHENITLDWYLHLYCLHTADSLL